MLHIGRNDPCLCGSGKKYKKCCLSNQQPTSSDGDWQLVSNTHKKLIHKLMDFTTETYGSPGYNEAWAEFNLWEDEEYEFDPTDELHPTFGPWMFYHWLPDPEVTGLSDEYFPHLIMPAELFIKKNRWKLSNLEMEDLQACLSRPYSFYDVLEVKAGEWVKVLDLLTEERVTVIEKTGSKTMKNGDLLFGKVITVRDICMFDGLAPFAFPPQFKVNIINERDEFRDDENSEITPQSLREYDILVLELFWNFYEAIFNPQPPILTNTDGDLMEPHTLTFKITSFEMAFEALHDLYIEGTPEELLERTEKAKNGNIKSLEFPWLIKGNKKNVGWENTVLGHITLKPKKMIVEVNSKNRSEKFLQILNERLTTGWVLESTKKENIQKLMAKAKEQNPNNNMKEEELGPEVIGHIKKMNEAHWESWPMIALPALKGKTPVEAIKSDAGRAAVSALLTDFERSAERKPFPGQDIETFKKLRARLGL